MSEDVSYSPGLAGVVAGMTEISKVYGDEGRLIYRGYDIRDLARHATYEEVLFLLLEGRLPKKEELDTLQKDLQREYEVDPKILKVIEELPQSLPPMDILRSSVSLLSGGDPDYGDDSPEAERRRAIRLVAKTPTLVAYDAVRRAGRSWKGPRSDLSLAGNFLYMLHGETQPESFVAAFDAALILHADHGFNASTFVARAITSTLSDMYSAVVGAVGALKGPLHGGANEAVVHMLQDLKSVAEVESWVKGRLERKELIYGFGHRVYRVDDPRALILRESAQRMAKEVGQFERFEMIERMREVMLKEKNLHPNVDLYSGIVYERLGIPTEFFTPIFAISRMGGWVAHVMEQLADNKIYRPSEWYKGPDHLTYIPLDERS
ncbi:MAG: citrate/2-methylcitrate synthase [Bacillota bacterium]|nr:citrate/2-methylcitrate synthase [Bacillota bacterium]